MPNQLGFSAKNMIEPRVFQFLITDPPEPQKNLDYKWPARLFLLVYCQGSQCLHYVKQTEDELLYVHAQ